MNQTLHPLLKEIDGVISKECNGCQKWKPLSDFPKRPDRPIGVRPQCRDCQTSRHNEWRHKNIDHAREYSGRYRKTDKYRDYIEKNRERALALQKNRRDKNLESYRDRERDYRKNNPSIAKASREKYRSNPENRAKERKGNSRWWKENRDSELEKDKAWRKENPDKVSAIKHRRRARLLGSDEHWTAKQWRELFAFCGKQCLCCGRTADQLRELGIWMSKDHVVPLSRGGTNSIKNLQPLCWDCHKPKFIQTTDYRSAEIIEFANRISEGSKCG